MQETYQRWLRDLDAAGIPASLYLDARPLDSNRVLTAVRGTAQALVRLSAVAFLMGVVIVFFLAEATVFPFKLMAILRRSGGTLRLKHIVGEVQAYLGLKFIISLATGVCVTVLCQLAAVDFPVLLGFIAFVLNFVPTIGSILAAGPGVLLALLQHGEPTAIVVGLGYLAINTVIGNIMDPQIMGHRLGLSTLVVVLSLLFWGWVWGPVGALLSVPLTMAAKIVLQNVPDLRWIAILLDKDVPPEPEPVTPPQVTPPQVPPMGQAPAA
jgi:predicted PurR-regulated permease PerM